MPETKFYVKYVSNEFKGLKISQGGE